MTRTSNIMKLLRIAANILLKNPLKFNIFWDKLPAIRGNPHGGDGTDTDKRLCVSEGTRLRWVGHLFHLSTWHHLKRPTINCPCILSAACKLTIVIMFPGRNLFKGGTTTFNLFEEISYTSYISVPNSYWIQQQ